MLQVGEILDKREQIASGRVEYLVRWKKYPIPAEDTWEPLANLAGAQAIVNEFEKVR